MLFTDGTLVVCIPELIMSCCMIQFAIDIYLETSPLTKQVSFCQKEFLSATRAYRIMSFSFPPAILWWTGIKFGHLRLLLEYYTVAKGLRFHHELYSLFRRGRWHLRRQFYAPVYPSSDRSA